MNLFSPPPADLSRPRFVQGVAIGRPVAGLGLLRPSNVWALTNRGHPTVLSGPEFALELADTPVTAPAATRAATPFQRPFTGPILRWRGSPTVCLRVTHHLHVLASK